MTIELCKIIDEPSPAQLLIFFESNATNWFLIRLGKKELMVKVRNALH